MRDYIKSPCPKEDYKKGQGLGKNNNNLTN
jgi:hypothetical protein